MWRAAQFRRRLSLWGAAALPLLFVSGGSACRLFQKSTAKPKDGWNPITSNPDALLPDGSGPFETRFFELPLAGELPKVPWSDTYWPSYLGGITWRWYAEQQGDSFTGEGRFNLKSPTRVEVAAMTLEQRKRLSPAEKYSILLGDFDYKLVKLEHERIGRVPGPGGSMVERLEKPWQVPTWEGLCHAWTPASAFFDEPAPHTMRTDDGVEIPFGSSDIKALLIRFTHDDQGFAGDPHFTRSVGELCQLAVPSAEASQQEACSDTNPGAFHIVVTNRIGVLKKHLFADMYNGNQVWNHPLYRYKASVLSVREPGVKASVNAVREVVVRMSLDYVVEVNPKWEKAGAEPKTVTLTYALELDDQDRIVGGEWLQGSLSELEFSIAAPQTATDRPDNLWTRGEPRWSYDRGGIDWTRLEALYKAATSQGRPQ